ncbi:hypothetical protein BV372_15445 [Nostoc sp. T09]|nr:hypothetical protein BV372_15445 [Nostoc sp. T09]
MTENISIATQGACNQKTLFKILIKTASSGDSIENITKILNQSLCGRALRYHLEKTLRFTNSECVTTR